MQKRRLGVTKQDNDHAGAENDFYRRSAINKALGMNARHPFAFQLTESEVDAVLVAITAHEPPVPIATADNGLRMLVDPWREEARRREHSLIPDASPEERRARYASYPGVLS